MKISVKQWREKYDVTDDAGFQEALEEATMDDGCPAMCSEGCYVEPDGKCPHGGPSLLRAMGMI